MSYKSNDTSKLLNAIISKGSNRTCFECGEKGTTYVNMDFGTFVCSNCAGILRELSYKVKGTGVTIFSEKDINFIGQNGNDNARKIWLGKFNPKVHKLPNPKKREEVKQFIIDKYRNKKYYKKQKGNNPESDEDYSEEEEEEKPKNNNKNEKVNNKSDININKGKLNKISIKGSSNNNNNRN
jgi:hypothetical protein